MGVSAYAKEFPAVPGEFVVKLKTTAGSFSSMRLERTLGAKVKETINKNEQLILVSRPSVEMPQASLQALNSLAIVEYAEPNYIYKVVGGSPDVPTDSELGKLWGMSNTGQETDGDMGKITGKAGIDIGALEAWKVETGSRDVIVAVIDTGVNWSNPDLNANIYVNEAEKNGTAEVDDDNNGCVDDVYGCDFAKNDGDPMDVYGHGTHVSGTIGAMANNGTGVVGVAWNVRILPVRFLNDSGSGTLADAVKSIDYSTAMKANIMSNSWGGGGFSQALMDSITRAKDAGILFVAAAGNSSNDNDASPEYPASYQVDNVISVAAQTAKGDLAYFSNYGKTSVHLAAPGANVLSYTMQGLESWSGTSMACPHVSGVAALLLSQDMTQPYNVIKQRLMDSARPLGSLRNRVVAGMVNANYALRNEKAPNDPDDPFFWQKMEQAGSTDHPYAHKLQAEWTVKVEGAKRIALYFSRFQTEPGYDEVAFIVNGEVVAKMSGDLGETYSPVIEGDTVTLRFTSDDSVNMYGFDIAGVAYQ